MNDNEKLRQAWSDIDYALNFVPKEFHTPSFMQMTCWEAYLKGFIPNPLWSQMDENGMIKRVDSTDGLITIVDRYFPYPRVLEETAKTREDPDRSRMIVFDAAVWAVRADDTMDYYRHLKRVQEELLNVRLSCFGWVVRIVVSLFLVGYSENLGDFSESGLGFLSIPFEYSVWFLLWIILWSPVYLAFKRSKNNKPQADEIEKECEETLRVYHFFKEIQNEIPFVTARIRTGSDISSDAFIYMVNLIDQGRARDLAEAQNIYEEDRRAQIMNHQYNELQRKIDYNNTMTTINTITNAMNRK